MTKLIISNPIICRKCACHKLCDISGAPNKKGISCQEDNFNFVSMFNKQRLEYVTILPKECKMILEHSLDEDIVEIEGNNKIEKFNDCLIKHGNNDYWVDGGIFGDSLVKKVQENLDKQGFKLQKEE